MSASKEVTPCENHPYKNHTWIQLHEVIVDREYQLECVKDELKRISMCESESRRKDELISALRKEIAGYKKCTQSKDISYASMEEHLLSYESHLQEKIKEVDELQSELDSVRVKLKDVTAKSTLKRKECARLSENIARLEEEIKNIKGRQRSDADNITLLKMELAEKKQSTGSCQEKIKRFHSNNQELQKQFKTLQAESVENERQLKTEIVALKSRASNHKQLKTKCDFIEQELTKANDKENELSIEIGRVEAELLQLCGHVLACTQTPESEQTISPGIATHAITQFAENHRKSGERLASAEHTLEEYEGSRSVLNGKIVQLCQLWREFQNGLKEDAVNAFQQLASSLQGTSSEDDRFDGLLSLMKECISTSYPLIEARYAKLDRIEDHTRSCYGRIKELKAEEDVCTMITNMADLLKSSASRLTKLEERMVENELEHSASLSGAVTDEKKKMADAIETIKSEEEERLQREIKILKEQHDVEKLKAISEERENIAALVNELEAIKQALEVRTKEKETLQVGITDMENKLHHAELDSSKEIETVNNQKMIMEQKFTEEMSGYKEKALQYALTIVALEEKLAVLMERDLETQTEREELKKNLDSVTTESTVDAVEKEKRLQKMEELTGALRNQLKAASVNNSRMEETIKQLESDILKQKHESEQMIAQQKEDHLREMADLQLSIAKQEGLMQSQQSEIETLTEALSRTTSELVSTRQDNARIENELSDLEKWNLENESKDHGGDSLIQAGHICLCEKHANIISDQKTAISQLRQRLNELELAKPPVGSHQATLKELSRVRHELMKARSDRLNETRESISPPKKENLPQVQFMDGNRSHEGAINQLEETLQCSERTYKNLVEAIYRAMPDFTKEHTQEGSTNQFDARDDQAAKKKMLKERKKFADSFYRKLVAVFQASAKTSDIDRHSSCSEGPETERNPEDVIAHLETMLSATTEELEQQKRLNLSLLKRKNFKESQLIASMQKPRHNCTSTSPVKERVNPLH